MAEIDKTLKYCMNGKTFGYNVQPANYSIKTNQWKKQYIPLTKGIYDVLHLPDDIKQTVLIKVPKKIRTAVYDENIKFISTP